MFGRLDRDVQVALRPFAEPAGTRRVAVQLERRPEFRNQLLPFPIRWGSRKIDHPRHADRQTEGSPDGRRPPAGVETCRGLRDSRRLDARFLTDMLDFIEGQAAGFGGQRSIARPARRRETEDLADLVVPVSTCRHSSRLYGGRVPRATAPPTPSSCSDDHRAHRRAAPSHEHLPEAHRKERTAWTTTGAPSCRGNPMPSSNPRRGGPDSNKRLLASSTHVGNSVSQRSGISARRAAAVAAVSGRATGIGSLRSGRGTKIGVGQR